MSIDLMVVDDDRLARQTLRSYFASTPDINVVVEAADGQSGIEILRNVTVDVVLCDVRMPRLDGVGFVRKARELGIPSRIVALTTFDEDQAMLAMLRAGARGFMLKSSRPSDIENAVRQAAVGGTVITPRSASRLLNYLKRPEDPGQPGLSRREQQVLRLLQQGLSNQEIAEQAHVSVSAVKKTVGRLMERFGTDSRLKLVIKSLDGTRIDG